VTRKEGAGEERDRVHQSWKEGVVVASLNIPEHVGAHASLHAHGLAVLELNTGGVTGPTGHFLLQLPVEVLLRLLLARLCWLPV
jgi:hypothetical protein